MFPSEAEYQYQLGRMHQMAGESAGSSEGEIGGKSDAACRAWRSAIELKPDMAEAYQMLALRLSRSSKKKKKLAAQNLAKGAKLAPDLPVSYVAVGMAYARQHADTAKLKASVRSKAIEAYSKALSMDDDGAGDKRLTAEYRAETSYHLGMLYAVVPKIQGCGLLKRCTCFRAARLMPAQPHYTEAAAQLEKSTEDFLAAQRRRKAEEEERQQQELRQQEDKAWEEDGEDAVW